MSFIRFAGSDTRVPIVNIYCIGRNYAKHIAELGNTGGETPVVFLKPTCAVLHDGGDILLPAHSTNVHHEAELVLLIGKSGKNIPKEEATRHIDGIGVGLDLTARDVQDGLKAKGLPWTIAKGFDTSACLSAFLPASAFENFTDISFSLDVNGSERQRGNTGMMLFPIDELVRYLSSIFTLLEGDVIFTGTPEGVGPIQSGDMLTLHLSDLTASFRVR